jgi:beta-galactosidase
VNYFRWDTATFGTEEYWHGLLNHDRSKSPAFEEIKQTLKELKSLGPELLNSQYDADSALLFDYDCSWAVKIQPQHYALSYTEQATTWYGCISPSHTGIDVILPGTDLAKYKIVYAPVVYVLAKDQAERIRNYVQNGGLFVTNFRLGTKNEASQIVRTRLPGLLRDVMGVTVTDYVPIYSPGQKVKFASALAGEDAEVKLWADILEPQTAEVLGTYISGEHAGKAAITVNRFGKGRAVYIGADLAAPSLARVLMTFAAQAGVKHVEAPRGIEFTTRRSGSKLWTFVLNHTPSPQKVSVPGSYRDALTQAPVAGTIDVEAYGVRVLQAT